MDISLDKSKNIMDDVEKQFNASSWRTLYDMNSNEDDSNYSDSPQSEYDSETCAEEDSDTTTTLG